VDPTKQYEFWQKYLKSIEALYSHAHVFKKTCTPKDHGFATAVMRLEQVASKFILLVKALAVDPTEQYEYWQKYLKSIEAQYSHAHVFKKTCTPKDQGFAMQSWLETSCIQVYPTCESSGCGSNQAI
jgi:hypothetical protein